MKQEINWISVLDEKMPYREDILVYDGQIVSMVQINKYTHHDYVDVPSYVIAHDSDVDLFIEKITHWARATPPKTN